MDQLRRFLLILTNVRHPAANVEEFRLACRTLESILPKQQKEFARSIGISGYCVWRARNIACVACRAFDLLESRGLELTKENFRMIRAEEKAAHSDTTQKKHPISKTSMGATIVLMAVEPWRSHRHEQCRIPRAKLKLPWRLRLQMAPWMQETRGRLRWMMSRLRNAF